MKTIKTGSNNDRKNLKRVDTDGSTDKIRNRQINSIDNSGRNEDIRLTLVLRNKSRKISSNPESK